MNKVKRIVFALLFALAAVPLSAQEKPEAGNGYIFRFVADKDMFFSPWSGNGKELERLLAKSTAPPSMQATCTYA